MNTSTTLSLPEKIKHLENEIIDQYINDPSPRPWIIGFSGGKDSTFLLQIVWYALRRIPAELLKRRIYVVCNDTMVENPKVVEFIDWVLRKVEAGAAEQRFPLSVHETTPEMNDTFWVNLIGRGYPAPNNVFRWCTDRLKIKPTTKFILDTISSNGEAIILLGTRHDESANRSQSLNKHASMHSRLRKHILKNAYVYAPIAHITTDEVWQYLASVPAPWGGNHHKLITLYKNASGGDCPLVIDTTTPSCGNNRFGCWVCTVVKRDKSMEALVDNGEEWMEALLDLRDYLLETRDNPIGNRSDYGRNGQRKPEGQWGPYLPHIRSEILRRLLQAQRTIRLEYGYEIDLVSRHELLAIQTIWLRERDVIDHVSTIYSEIEPESNIMGHTEEKRIQLEDELLLEACQGDEAQFDLIKSLVKVLESQDTKVRKSGMPGEIKHQIDKYLNHKVV